MKRILAGPHAVQEALRGPHRRQIEIIYLTEERRDSLSKILEEAEHSKITCSALPDQHMESLAKGLRHQGILAVAGDYPYIDLEALMEETSPGALLVALDEITDPHNLGATIRSAVALGAAGLIMPRHRSARVNATVVRVSAGATERARIARVTNLAQCLADLTDRGCQVVGLDSEGTSQVSDLPQADGPRVLVLGSEGRGLRRLVRQRCSILARIPLAGPIASLNASAAASIAIYEALRSR